MHTHLYNRNKGRHGTQPPVSCMRWQGACRGRREAHELQESQGPTRRRGPQETASDLPDLPLGNACAQRLGKHLRPPGECADALAWWHSHACSSTQVHQVSTGRPIVARCSVQGIT